MRINTNIPALNTHRMMGITNRSAAKNLEKLSSGKRLNRSSDDAAGLAISEKMEAQIRGLRMASKNSLDGMSLIQTAEGALNEVHAMLQRMRELSVYAANGSLVKEDREAIQGEINQLTSQINTIGYGTEFNKLSLLQGYQGPKTNTIESKMSTAKPAKVAGSVSIASPVTTQLDNKDLKIEINGKPSTVNLEGFIGAGSTLTREELLERLRDAVGFDANVYLNDENKIVMETKSAGGTQEIKLTGSAVADIFGGVTEGSGEPESSAKYAQGYLIFEKLPEAGSSMTVGETKIDFYDSAKGGPYKGTNESIDLNGITTLEDVVDKIITKQIPGVAMSKGSMATIQNEPNPKPADFPTVSDEKMKNMVRFIAHQKGLDGHKIELEGSPKDLRVVLQVGANEKQFFRMDVGDCRSINLRISALKNTASTGVEGASYTKIRTVTGKDGSNLKEYAIDVMDEKKASAAITVFDNAIGMISEERSKMGAIQNRLEKTIANLDNTAENLTAAKSRIADTDMALEMSEFSKLNIMQQAGTAMLAQANQQPQLMLKLLNA